ncbi:MAG: hypothetical protein HYR94_00155 [Chloroflexi bacterium]|nr:hypothetical protein [Chloroflexota bacterium]
MLRILLHRQRNVNHHRQVKGRRTFTGATTTNLLMKGFGFDPPKILGILKVMDGMMVRLMAEEVGPLQ